MVFLLFDPVGALEEAKKKRNLSTSLIVLLISSLLIVLTIIINSSFLHIPISSLIDMKFPILIWAFVFVFFGGLFFGFVLILVINILGGNGNYFSGLTITSYSLFPFSIGFLITCVIAFGIPQPTNANLMLLKYLFAFAISMIFTSSSIAIVYRGIKELFETDIVTALVGTLVISIAYLIPLYIILFASMLSTIFGMLTTSMMSGRPVIR